MIAKRFLLICYLLALSITLISCNPDSNYSSDDEGNYSTPTIKGSISIPSIAGLSANDMTIEVFKGEASVYRGKVKSDGSFTVSNLDYSSSYNVLITSVSSSRDVSPSTYGWGCWKRDVTPVAGEGNNVGRLDVKPLGAIEGYAFKDGAIEHYDTTVYLPGSSYSAITDKDGYFFINNVPQGSYSIRFTSTGFVSVNDNVIVASDDDSTNPLIKLTPCTLAKDIFEISYDGKLRIKESDIEYARSLSSLTIPNQVNGIEVKGFRDGAFSDCSFSIIAIPGSVTSIGSSVFSGCSHLVSIVLPANLESIGELAFSGCSSLLSIEIPNTVTSIGSKAFSGCSSLSSIVIPENASFSVGDDEFHGCNSLLSFVIPAGVTSIGNKAFYECSSLSSIEIPDTVTSIGSEAFYDCSDLEDIDLSDNLTSIGHHAFQYCTGLKSVKIPNGVTSIGFAAFIGCENIESLELPSSLTEISSILFYDCDSLYELTFNGTIEQWESIYKNTSSYMAWNDNSVITTIHCLDGDVAI